MIPIYVRDLIGGRPGIWDPHIGMVTGKVGQNSVEHASGPPRRGALLRPAGRPDIPAVQNFFVFVDRDF